MGTEHVLDTFAGKTTLLRIMAGDDAADGGVVRRIDGVRVGFLKQDPEMDPE
jgi:ATPase subunit of ABC transporter with duplicated ATPase domains